MSNTMYHRITGRVKAEMALHNIRFATKTLEELIRTNEVFIDGQEEQICDKGLVVHEELNLIYSAINYLSTLLEQTQYACREDHQDNAYDADKHLIDEAYETER